MLYFNWNSLSQIKCTKIEDWNSLVDALIGGSVWDITMKMFFVRTGVAKAVLGKQENEVILCFSKEFQVKMLWNMKVGSYMQIFTKTEMRKWKMDKMRKSKHITKIKRNHGWESRWTTYRQLINFYLINVESHEVIF